MTNFRLLVLAMTAAIGVVTAAAIGELGLPAGLWTFLNDLRHPWRLQFYSDLEIHLVLVACWMTYRERSNLVGVCCGMATLALGALFTGPYVLIASSRASGDVIAFLIGPHRVGRHRHSVGT